MSTIIKFSIIFLISIFISSSALAQTTNNDNPKYKDPSTSQILGIVPGGGHFYSGEVGTGAISLGSAVLAPIIGAAVTAENNKDELNPLEWNAGPFIVGLAVSLGA